MRLTAGDVHAEAVEVEVRAQAESVSSEQFQQRLAALQAKIRQLSARTRGPGDALRNGEV